MLAILGGLPLGFRFLSSSSVLAGNRFIYLVASVLVNVRSVPFVILLVLLLPLTQLCWAIPVARLRPPRPLSVAAIAFYAAR